LVNSALNVNKTMVDYHKLLLDEVLHLQEMSIQIQHSTHDLDQLKVKLENIKEDLRNI
jgi:uncharacterized membrane protein YjjP (DUF1212 family)